MYYFNDIYDTNKFKDKIINLKIERFICFDFLGILFIDEKTKVSLNQFINNTTITNDELQLVIKDKLPS